MKIEVVIQEGRLQLPALALPGCGAVARFDGIVRGEEDGQPIEGLFYEAYQSMAERVMRELLEGLHGEHTFHLARVHHRIGWVPVGEAAICVDVHAPHRKEAFAVLTRFMDLLKQEVPIWKGVKP